MWLFLGKNFEVVFEINANWVSDFQENLARVYYDDYIAFIDKTGNEVAKIENNNINNIDWIDDFKEGLARAQFKDGTMCYFDKEGKIVYRTQ